MVPKGGLFTQSSLGTVYALKIGGNNDNNRQDAKFYQNGFSWRLCVLVVHPLPQFEFVKRISFCSNFAGWRVRRLL